MPVKFQKTLPGLRNKRDLRAEMLALAAALTTNHFGGRLTVIDPVISASTVQQEWDRLLPALAPDVGRRMTLVIANETDKTREHPGSIRMRTGVVLLDRPNYRYEVLRLLVGASLEDDGPQPIQGLMDIIGASQTPIRQALSELKQAGIAHSWGHGVELAAEEVSAELMAKMRALPQTLRFRFERGSQIKPPAMLLERVLPLMLSGASTGWATIWLSGTPVAQADAPSIDLRGMPRLDLVAHVKRDAKSFDTGLLRLLDDGLELEPNVLAPAPVVVTLVRADRDPSRDAGIKHSRSAPHCDVFLSLLDLGLREQAQQYAKAVRR